MPTTAAIPSKPLANCSLLSLPSFLKLLARMLMAIESTSILSSILITLSISFLYISSFSPVNLAVNTRSMPIRIAISTTMPPSANIAILSSSGSFFMNFRTILDIISIPIASFCTALSIPATPEAPTLDALRLDTTANAPTSATREPVRIIIVCMRSLEGILASIKAATAIKVRERAICLRAVASAICWNELRALPMLSNRST